METNRQEYDVHAALMSAFAQALDAMRIERIVSAEYAEDGRTFLVQLEMPDGRWRTYSFKEGEPVSISDNE